MGQTFGKQIYEELIFEEQTCGRLICVRLDYQELICKA
jgi:hypothetical protein